MWKDVALFYVVGAVVVGLRFGTAGNVEGTFMGRPIPWPRVTGGIVVGALWPIALVQFVWQAR